MRHVKEPASAPPVVTQALIGQLESVAAESALSVAEGLLAVPGNPYRVSEVAVDGARAFATPSLPHFPPLNRCFGLERPRQLDGILAFYRQHRAPPNLDLAPDQDTPELVTELCRRGLRPTSTFAVMYGAPEPPDLSNGYLEIRQVEADSFDQFLAIYLEGFRVPAADREWTRAFLRHRLQRPGWRLYLARHGRESAAVAQLFVRDHVALLSGTATRPAFRQRGCHRALLVHRLHDAAGQGCDLAISQAGLGTTSQANLARAGLALAYTKATWSAPAPTG
jgi:GNAT superfamily N-acetyltransferase